MVEKRSVNDIIFDILNYAFFIIFTLLTAIFDAISTILLTGFTAFNDFGFVIDDAVSSLNCTTFPLSNCGIN